MVLVPSPMLETQVDTIISDPQARDTDGHVAMSYSGVVFLDKLSCSTSSKSATHKSAEQQVTIPPIHQLCMREPAWVRLK